MAVEVLPRTATDLTLPGPTVPRHLLQVALLIIQSGESDVPTELTLWTTTAVLLFGLLEPPNIRILSSRFRKVRAIPDVPTPLSDLPPIMSVDFAKADPPFALQVIITILLTVITLGLTLTPTSWLETAILPAPHFKQERRSAPA